MKPDYSDEALKRMADAEDVLGEIGGGGSAVGGWAQANRRHNEAIAALHAFGEAIATIARAQMIARVGVGCAYAERIAERSVSLSVYGPSRSTDRFCATLSSASAVGVVVLNNWTGDRFDDFAAEAVAALIEECER